jgi:RNA polymerase sporulation-specific sigma factor
MKKMTEEQKKLVEDNICLAGYIAKRYAGKNIEYSYDEVFCNAAYGLCKAGLTFNPDKGAKFTTYAGRCIENEIKMLMRKRPVSYETLEIMDNRIPDESCPVEYGRILDLIVLKEIFATLEDYEKTIIEMLFYYDLPQKDVADVLKISRAYVSRLAKKTREKIAKLKLGEI